MDKASPELTIVQATRFDNNGRSRSAIQKINGAQLVLTARQTPMTSTKARMVCLGEVSPFAILSQQAATRNKARERPRSMLRHRRQEEVRGKIRGEWVDLKTVQNKADLINRLGLHLIDNYARGSPAWAAWRARFNPLLYMAQAAQVPSHSQVQNTNQR